jgi:uncharacterized protein YneR
MDLNLNNRNQSILIKEFQHIQKGENVLLFALYYPCSQHQGGGYLAAQGSYANANCSCNNDCNGKTLITKPIRMLKNITRTKISTIFINIIT